MWTIKAANNLFQRGAHLPPGQQSLLGWPEEGAAVAVMRINGNAGS